jgi:hypothetical protein
MHEGILCDFKKEKNELIPFIIINELTSMQLLAVDIKVENYYNNPLISGAFSSSFNSTFPFKKKRES